MTLVRASGHHAVQGALRSRLTQMGRELARHLRMVMIARARGASYLVYSGAENVVGD